jgi:uncharacterized repeat protein (TIGR03803 family)
VERMRNISILLLIVANAAWAAGGLKVLQSFGIGNLDMGSDLYGGPILDASGNVYGVAESGGIYGAGVVYELSPAGGAWTETVLYNFQGANRNQDGANPHATLLADSAGNLYGTTVNGGLASRTCRTGCGTVFMLSQASGQWQETVLYRFTGGVDGSVPYAGVVMDPAGNLYGATLGGGASQSGVLYKLAPGPDSTWTQSVVYNFPGRPGGAAAYVTPVLDATGNLYGTTNTGGAHNLGVVYKVTPQPDGTGTVQLLHSFAGGADGANPLAGVVFDQHGNLYGTTSYGGTANCGIAFALAPNQSGGWTEYLLHTFLGVTAQDGENPNGLTFDAHGNLYGTSTGGGVDNPGTIFKIARASGGGWQETVLYSFTAGDDGAYPSSDVVLDPSGRIYGTTLWGGPSGDTTGGVAFQFTQ